MEITTCYRYLEKECLEHVADTFLRPFRYLMNGKTIYVIDQIIIRNEIVEHTFLRTVMAIAAFSVTIITGFFLFSALYKWLTPPIKAKYIEVQDLNLSPDEDDDTLDELLWHLKNAEQEVDLIHRNKITRSAEAQLSARKRRSSLPMCPLTNGYAANHL